MKGIRLNPSSRLKVLTDNQVDMIHEASLIILERTGIRFRIQTLRATFGQMSIDWGVRLDAVSRALRHTNSKTTELYYARIRPDHAFRLIDEAYIESHSAK